VRFVLLATATVTTLACDPAPLTRSAPPAPPPTIDDVGLAARRMPSGVAAAMAPRAVRPPATVEPAEAACPSGMALVEGSYCTNVRHRCLKYLDGAGRYAEFRCERYAEPAECVGVRRALRFCMDLDEYAASGETLPANFRSYTDAKRTCGAQGKRVCRESEWNFACEGEQMRPYPYGFERDSAACNADQSDLLNAEGKLKDRRAPSNAYPRCVSPFGIRNLAGNLEEFVQRDDVLPEAPAMKGAYWQPGRNQCRAAQTAHDAYYNGMETGFRCCADPSG